MPYFIEHQHRVRLPVGLSAVTQLHRGQRGAVHAIASHFTLNDDTPALVVMPTGSGKTAVLSLVPFLLDAERVLVVTPSRLVRTQVADEFRRLNVLRRTDVLPKAGPQPAVHEVEHRVTSSEQWEELAAFDVVVGTPYTISPAMKDVAEPPPAFFDLILVDEAHHSPATTWRALLDAFPKSRRVLFTATPFRQDRREIRGQLVYSYPLSQAYEDGVFGEIHYEPVVIVPEEGSDISIAKAAERVYQADRAGGNNHVLMVRGSTKKHASELAELYRDHTSLRLEVVDSNKSYREAQAILDRLRDGDLNGVVCVDMMGEGFDFPNLKIAALHSPHKSLAVTLQFIGRFARTSGDNLGRATFLAVPSEIKIEAEELYREGRIWSTILPDLLDQQVAYERQLKERLASFELRAELDDAEIADLSLYALRPYHHVKVYEVKGKINLDADMRLPPPRIVVHRRVSTALNAAIGISVKIARPRWAASDAFIGKQYELIIVYHSIDTGLLFICASERTDPIYERLLAQFSPEGAEPLLQQTVERAMAGLENIRIFNLGLRKRQVGRGDETYRNVTGPKAHQALTTSDGASYAPGHVFATAVDGEGHAVNLGYSSAAKVWSNATSQIPDLIEWCEILARRIRGDAMVVTNSPYDAMVRGRRATSIPSHPIAANWSDEDYQRPPRVRYRTPAGNWKSDSLLNFDLIVAPERSDTTRVGFSLRSRDIPDWPAEFQLDGQLQFRTVGESPFEIEVEHSGDWYALITHFTGRPLTFYFAGGEQLIGRELHQRVIDWLNLDPEQIEPVDWNAMRVDIQREFETSDKPPLPGLRSIHAYLEEWLCAEEHDIVFYDHTTGEIADFLTIRRLPDAVCFEAYHCKGSGDAKPGNRIGDVEEVSGQVVKCLALLQHPERLEAHLKRREREVDLSRFIRGDRDSLEHMMRSARALRSIYRVAIVQPGVTRSGLRQNVADILAPAHNFLVSAGCDNLRVLVDCHA